MVRLIQILLPQQVTPTVALDNVGNHFKSTILFTLGKTSRLILTKVKIVLISQDISIKHEEKVKIKAK